MKYTLFCLFVILCYQLGSAKTKQSVVIISNPMKLEYSIQLEISNAVILESQKEIDTVSVDNPIYNTELDIYVYFAESWIDRTAQINTDTVFITLTDSLITVPSTAYNIDLAAHINFIRTNFSEDSMQVHSSEELDNRVAQQQRIFDFKYPRAENTVSSLRINGYCERISSSYMDSIIKFWDSAFIKFCPEAQRVLKLKTRKFYEVGQNFPLSKFISVAKTKQSNNNLKLIMVSNARCGFTEYWLQRLKKQSHLFAEKYYFHVETKNNKKLETTPNFKEVFVPDGTFNDDLFGLRVCGTPYFVVLDSKNKILFLGSGGELKAKYFKDQKD
jgi:hypothetical protein